MGWSEQRGTFWRARWRDPAGKVESVSGFLTEKAADQHWQDQESDIRNHRYRDPRSGQILFEDWVNDHWVPTWDLELSSIANYEYHLEHNILPDFTGRALASIAPEEVNAWERVVAEDTSASTANTARAVLTACLSAAVPHRIQANPAQRKRATGRRAARRVARIQAKRKTWASPLQVFLLAERVATLTGRDEDFVLIVSIAYTGMRWSEAIGLHPELIHKGKWDINWKLYELRGRFYRQYPKDGSIRTVDTPPFLDGLMAELLEGKDLHCACKPDTPKPYCRGDKFVFLSASQVHRRRSNYARDTFKPAAHGRWPAEGGMRPRPSLPVLTDVSQGYMGTALVTTFPDEWTILARLLREEMERQGVTKLKHATGKALQYADAMNAIERDGPFWPSLAYQRWQKKRAVNSNSKRADLIAHAIGQGLAPAKAEAMTRRQLLDHIASEVCVSAWRPLVPELTPHGLRHGHETWMAEDRIADVLRDERMGHGSEEDGTAARRGSMRDHYTKISQRMRDELVEALQGRWDQSIQERLAMEEHWPEAARRSPVAIVNRLLDPHRNRKVSPIKHRPPRKLQAKGNHRRVAHPMG